MLTFACPHCGRKLQAPEAEAGKGTKCPRCQAIAAVPALPRQPSTDSDRPLQPAAKEDTPTLPPPPLDQATVDQVSGVAARVEQGLAEDFSFLAPPRADDEIGRLGPYRVLKVLGAGGMGVVFQAQDTRLKRLVALKVIKPGLATTGSARARFLREAQVTAALKNDHIVVIHEVGEDRGAAFLAMEFLEGEPLDRRLAQNTPLPAAEVLRIGREAAEGLAAAHARGLVHRDIKPANIWLEGPRARVKILDFGLARGSSDEAHLTQLGAIVGTPSFMAPEQGRGLPLDARCDLFSLGCVLYRLCTGQLPFRGTDTISTLLAVATGQPRPPAEVAPTVGWALSDLVMQLLEKDPARRPGSAREVIQALAALEAEPGQTLPTPKRSSRSRSGHRTWRVAAALGGVLALGLLLALLFFGRGDVVEKRKMLVSDLPGGVKLEMVRIDPGTFLMGSPQTERRGIVGGEEIQHKVTLTKGFYLQTTLVSQKQWQAVMGSNPSGFKGDDLPVEIVSWFDAVEFCIKLSAKAGKKPCYSLDNVQREGDSIASAEVTILDDGKGYRLPTEAEWEYAARAGTKTPFWCGETITTEQANFNGTQPYRETDGKGEYREKTTPVKQFKANPWGLHDMHGNVWQWCEDWAGEYPNEDIKDPDGPEKSTFRVLRGGSWHVGAGDCRAAYRYGSAPAERDATVGFRVALRLD